MTDNTQDKNVRHTSPVFKFNKNSEDPNTSNLKSPIRFIGAVAPHVKTIKTTGIYLK